MHEMEFVGLPAVLGAANKRLISMFLHLQMSDSSFFRYYYSVSSLLS